MGAAEIEHDSVLAEKPRDFVTGIADSGGRHDGQAVVPDGDRYRCWCSCGEWEVYVADQAAGLTAARAHTAAAT